MPRLHHGIKYVGRSLPCLHHYLHCSSRTSSPLFPRVLFPSLLRPATDAEAEEEVAIIDYYHSLKCMLLEEEQILIEEWEDQEALEVRQCQEEWEKALAEMSERVGKGTSSSRRPCASTVR